MFSKIDVKVLKHMQIFGAEHPTTVRYFWSNGIKWNFTKFLIGKDGKVLNRFAPTTKPEDLQAEIEKALA